MNEQPMRRDLLRLGAVAALPLLGATADAAPAEPFSPAPRPEDFGARGDGVANDTEAVQRAAMLGPGGLHLTPGRIYCIDQLVIPDRAGWTLDGFDATLKKRNNGDNYALVACERHLKNIPYAQEPIHPHRCFS